VGYAGGSGFLFYKCAGCGAETTFAIEYRGPQFRLFGRWPSPRPEVPDAQKGYLSKEHQELYKQGLACETHKFGIGAAAYYRRIVEDVIEDLLKEIRVHLLESAETKKAYQERLEAVRETHVGSKKIDVVKELLPERLRPDGRNPLSLLYKALSEDIHQSSDAEVLKQAKTIRVVLDYLLENIEKARRSDEKFKSALDQLS
jgi:hypothetical protein